MYMYLRKSNYVMYAKKSLQFQTMQFDKNKQLQVILQCAMLRLTYVVKLANSCFFNHY